MACYCVICGERVKECVCLACHESACDSAKEESYKTGYEGGYSEGYDVGVYRFKAALLEEIEKAGLCEKCKKTIMDIIEEVYEHI